MYRTITQLPDAINASPQLGFTQIPNSILRNPELSLKAKGILCLLLSNKNGWKSYRVTLEKFLKEGFTAIDSALSELEQSGYLMRYKYRDIKTKVIKGGFWAYSTTPNSFDLGDYIVELQCKGYQIIRGGNSEKRDLSISPSISGFSRRGFSRRGKQEPNNTNNKNTKNKNIKKSKKPTLPNNWDDWINYKKEQFQFTYSRQGQKAAITTLFKLSDGDLDKASEIILQSMANGWKGFFAIREESKPKYKSNGSNGETKECNPTQIIEDEINASDSIKSSLLSSFKHLTNKAVFSNRVEAINKHNVCGAFCNLHEEIIDMRPKNLLKTTSHSDSIKAPHIIVREYVYWLENERWIREINTSLFDVKGRVFGMFLAKYNKEIGINQLTGQLS